MAVVVYCPTGVACTGCRYCEAARERAFDGERLLAAAESLEEAIAPHSFDDERQGALDTVREIAGRLIPKP